MKIPQSEDELKFCREQIHPQHRPHAALSKLYCQAITVLLGEHLFSLKIVILYYHKERSFDMLFVLAVVVVLLLLVLAGADLFVSQYNPDELSNMGVQEQ